MLPIFLMQGITKYPIVELKLVKWLTIIHIQYVEFVGAQSYDTIKT